MKDILHPHLKIEIISIDMMLEDFLEEFPFAVPAPLSVYELHRNRRQSVIVMAAALRNNAQIREDDGYDCFEIALEIERSCYNTTIIKMVELRRMARWGVSIFRTSYDSITFGVKHSLNYNNSPYLSDRIADGDIELSEIGCMTWNQLTPKNADLIDLAERRKNEIISQKTSKLYPCPKCKARNATYRDVQLRAGDEGKDLRLDCMECGETWTKSG